MILLGSGGLRTPERVAAWAAEMRAVLGDARRVLFVPFALADHDDYVRLMIERGLHAGYELIGIHKQANPIAAVEEAEAIFVGGGNTFRLLDALYRLRLLKPIRAAVRRGAPYLGISAGTNVACPTIKTTNDMPIVQPLSLNALGLVPFQINPHYYSGANFVRHGDAYHEHFGETRDDRLREFHEENEIAVVGLREGAIMRIGDGRADLLAGSARLFRRGETALELAEGATLDDLLQAQRGQRFA